MKLNPNDDLIVVQQDHRLEKLQRLALEQDAQDPQLLTPESLYPARAEIARENVDLELDEPVERRLCGSAGEGRQNLPVLGLDFVGVEDRARGRRGSQQPDQQRYPARPPASGGRGQPGPPPRACFTPRSRHLLAATHRSRHSEGRPRAQDPSMRSLPEQHPLRTAADLTRRRR